MSVSLAEQPQRKEKYAASLTAIRALGEASLSGAGLEAANELAYDDFVTKVGEMLKTDEEYGHAMDIARVKQFNISGGKVRAADGTPMVELVRNGLEASRQSDDARLRDVQSKRDAADVFIAEKVDELAIGQSMIVVSMEPKHELRGRDAQFWRGRGYREGIAYIQWYSRVDENQMWASAYSADHSDRTAWGELLRSRGVQIETDDPNQFITNIWQFEADADQARLTAEQLRREYYESVGQNTDRLSVDAYLEANDRLMQSLFETYYPAVARSLVRGTSEKVLRDFAHDALARMHAGKLEPEVMHQLIRVANMQSFDEEMARAFDQLIPYAAVEQLRKGLGRAPKLHAYRSQSQVVYRPVEFVPGEVAQHQQQIHQLVLGGVQRGVEAGRSYGGCSGSNLAISQADEQNEGLQQDIFGGSKEGDSYPAGEDQYGPLTFKCTEGHTNTRSRGKLLTECSFKSCKKGSVGCK